jgi:hypothetical protein
MIRKVKDGEMEVVECDLHPDVVGRILESILRTNEAIVRLLSLSVVANNF